MTTMQKITIPTYGMQPLNISASVTCGGAIPLR